MPTHAEHEPDMTGQEVAPEAVDKPEMSEDERLQRLDALATSLAAKRRDAINYRSQSGIEQVWLEDEDAFDGIDDANRAQEGASGQRHRYTKAETSSGTYTKTVTDNDNACILLPNITGPYVESAAAAIADMLLPLDDWPFALDTTPIPELAGVMEKVKELPDQQGVMMPGMQQPMAAGEIKAKGEAEIERAKKCAEKAETRIKDWLTECQWHGKSRRQIDDAARVGTGIVKGPIPQRKKHYRWSAGADGVQQLEIHEETKPVTENVDYWNLFPDPACGENIHNGSYIWERAEITKKTLQDLRGGSGYIDRQIELCLQEGPLKSEINVGTKVATGDNTLYEVWYFHGALEREDVEAAGCDCRGYEEKYISIPAVITIVNGRPIRAALNHLDKGSFPYDILTWRRRPSMPWGQGIARQIRPAQRALTACFRAMMENAGLSAKPMLAVLRKYLSPVDGTWNLYGGKVFEVDPTADISDIKAAITAIPIESRQVELLRIIQFAKELAEDITNNPLLLQGQMGKTPDTVGVANILNNNASVTKRRIARQFDDQVIEPGITRYYDYLMQYGEDEEEKGLFVVDARGSSVLVERDIQNQGMLKLLEASGNPNYGADPRKAFAEACRAMKIDPKQLQYSDDEWKKIQENAQKQPADPSVQVAQIRAEADARMEEMRQGFEAQQAELDRQLASAELSSEERRDLEKQKVLLAKVAMELRVTKDMAVADHRMDLHKHQTPPATPPIEPPGRAQPGQSFQA